MAIRGLWSAPSYVCSSSTPYFVLSFALAKTKRQGGGGDLSVYNGAFGVDSQDILNAPDIDFGTFQLFPDLVNYGAQGTASDVQPPSRQFGKTLNDTVDWINAQIYSARTWVFPLLTAAASDLRSPIS
jgi:mannan endo-1,4-beta-mannosidase